MTGKKKFIFITLCFLLCHTLVKAQFTLTPSGLRDQSDTTKSYVVLSFPGQIQDQIAAKIKDYITLSYVSAKEVLSESGNAILSIHGSEDISYKGFAFQMGYTLSFSVKGERVKVSPVILKIDYNERSFITVSPSSAKGAKLVSASIFSKNGDLKMDKVKSQIEDFFNHLTNGAGDFVSGKVEEEDW